MIDSLLTEYKGYTYRTLMADIEDYPDWFGGALATISARRRIEAERSGDAKLDQSEVHDKAKASAWAKGRAQQSKSRMAEANAALQHKFPGMI